MTLTTKQGQSYINRSIYLFIYITLTKNAKPMLSKLSLKSFVQNSTNGHHESATAEPEVDSTQIIVGRRSSLPNILETQEEMENA